MAELLIRCCSDDAGATAIEYALMAGLIALVIVGGVTAIGTQVAVFFERAAGPLD